MGIITSDNVNLRSTATINGTVLQFLPKNTPIKVTGPSVTADNFEWVSVQLYDGTNGFVTGNYLKRFNLNELYGKDRYETSVQISEFGWKEPTDAVVLGRGDIPIDALTGSVLAAKFKAPLLLTYNNNLPENVLAEIDRLKPKMTYILGGEGAISQEILSTIVKKGYSVKRIGGRNRFDTSIQVANEVGVTNEIILATGNNSPDPLSIAPYAGKKQIPIILSQQNSLPDEVKALIRNQNINKITIIGGENAVSKNVASEISNLGNIDIERIQERIGMPLV